MIRVPADDATASGEGCLPAKGAVPHTPVEVTLADALARGEAIGLRSVLDEVRRERLCREGRA